MWPEIRGTTNPFDVQTTTLPPELWSPQIQWAFALEISLEVEVQDTHNFFIATYTNTAS